MSAACFQHLENKENTAVVSLKLPSNSARHLSLTPPQKTKPPKGQCNRMAEPGPTQTFCPQKGQLSVSTTQAKCYAQVWSSAASLLHGAALSQEQGWAVEHCGGTDPHATHRPHQKRGQQPCFHTVGSREAATGEARSTVQGFPKRRDNKGVTLP